jgi:hypothetical protein
LLHFKKFSFHPACLRGLFGGNGGQNGTVGVTDRRIFCDGSATFYARGKHVRTFYARGKLVRTLYARGKHLRTFYAHRKNVRTFYAHRKHVRTLYARGKHVRTFYALNMGATLLGQSSDCRTSQCQSPKCPYSNLNKRYSTYLLAYRLTLAVDTHVLAHFFYICT